VDLLSEFWEHPHRVVLFPIDEFGVDFLILCLWEQHRQHTDRCDDDTSKRRRNQYGGSAKIGAQHPIVPQRAFP
jgi:hypothetical protein